MTQSSFHFTRLFALKRPPVALALLLCMCITSCNGGKKQQTTATNGIPSVAVSIPPLEYFAKAIGGDSLQTTTLLPAGTDPETFEPGMGTLRELNRSGALITSGELPFEHSVTSKLNQNNPDLKIFPMSPGIDLIYGTHSHKHSDEGEHNHPEASDPHIWASVVNARTIADNMLRALCLIAPEHETYYRSRHRRLIQHIDSIDGSFRHQLSRLPSRTFLIWHPSLSYFARDYGLQQIAFNVENKETSPLQLQQSINRANAGQPLAFFIPEGLDQRQSASITAATGIEPVCVNFMSADWEKDMQTIISALTATPK